MVILLDHFVIAVKAVWDEGSGGIRKMNPAFFIDKERDRYERKLTSGIILNKPLVCCVFISGVFGSVVK